MVDGNLVAVHRVGEHGAGVPGDVDGEAALEGDGRGPSVDGARVGTAEHDLSGLGLTPARSSTSASGTPVHSAVLTAPWRHCSPGVGGSSRKRPLPAHSSVTTVVCDGI